MIVAWKISEHRPASSRSAYPDYPNEHYTTRTERRYGLNLEVRLKNGKVKSFDFDVTDQVAVQPQGGVIVVSGIEISDEEGTEGGSGFDVTVKDWGEYETSNSLSKRLNVFINLFVSLKKFSDMKKNFFLWELLPPQCWQVAAMMRLWI